MSLGGVQAVGSTEHRPANGGTTAGGREAIGCTSFPGAIVTSGPGSTNQVALTFDDGPSLRQTPKILAVLERFDVQATFFVLGRHVVHREELLGEMLASGHELANHSFHHSLYPSYGELAATNRRIEQATGFWPCLFRPPYGLINNKVTAAARRTGLEQVLWDVDSLDSKHPGAAAIAATVINQAGAGSIVLMHDGGHHPQTVRALPRIIKGLRARGFGFATVTALLGGRVHWGQSGSY